MDQSGWIESEIVDLLSRRMVKTVFARIISDFHRSEREKVLTAPQRLKQDIEQEMIQKASVVI